MRYVYITCVHWDKEDPGVTHAPTLGAFTSMTRGLNHLAMVKDHRTSHDERITVQEYKCVWRRSGDEVKRYRLTHANGRVETLSLCKYQL